ncbi:MAG: 3-deoxy-7-phosphoheptulonate synthase [Patescibacteria group bacterium]|mgnify:CR=1 FL=1
MQSTHNWHIQATRPIITPRDLTGQLPITPCIAETVILGRQRVQDILDKKNRRLLVIAGPCSIHDPLAAIAYARHLAPIRDEFADRMEIIMRVYFEKPRTVLGWKGLINDPHLNGSNDIETGLKIARRLLLDIVGIGMPVATEFLDPITPQFIADLVSWAAVGARTTESQTHREMASGLSMPVGFKNGTDGSIETAANAISAARSSHSFLGIDPDGRTAIIQSTGNKWCHAVLRGGKHGPNYSIANVDEAVATLRAARVPEELIVDCSHGNCGKKHALQELVWKSVVAQRKTGPVVVGAMLESNLHEGNQPLLADPKRLRYGQSITDACLGWADTERLLREGYEALG